MSALAKLAACCLTVPAVCLGQAHGPEPRNIIWIVADDLGYGDMGCYGSPDIKTPHLDALAGEGLRSTRFYAMPVCSPTRAALLTGRSPQAVGVETALMGAGGLRAGTATLGGWLREQGYRTALVGKWHLGYTGKSLPNAQGFDEFFGHLGGKLHYYQHTDELNGKVTPDLWENLQPVERAGAYSTDLFTERAEMFVRANRDRPFFLMLSYNAPHYARGQKSGERLTPDHYLQAPPEWIRRTARDPDRPTMRELYAAVVEAMDAGVGRLMRTLDESGLRDRTLVVFLSDNGADTGHGGSSGVLSGHKAQLAEGGIRAALLARCPGRIPVGLRSETPMDVRDLWATSAALAGLPAPPAGLEGIDMSAAWQGRPGPDRDRCWAWRGERVVLRGPWKWHQAGAQSRLYDVQADPAEQHDLAQTQSERITSMAAAWQAWADRIGVHPEP